MSLKELRYSIYRKMPVLGKRSMAAKRRGYRIRVPVSPPYVSQYGQDKLICEFIFPNKQDGFFVDIGANDGTTLSNTLFLEKERGWKGICIEPQPDIFEQLSANRDCELHQCCITDKRGTMNFLKVGGDNNMLSGLADYLDDEHKERIANDEKSGESQTIEVECKTFDDVLGDRTKIDYINIDTEGAEVAILKCIDFKRYDIGSLSVENNYDSTEIYGILHSAGYELIAVAGDEIYVKKELAETLGSFDNMQTKLLG